MKLCKNKDGYIHVNLYNNGRKSFMLHRLVASAFIKNPNNYSEINHIDECKSNNKVNNLEWCTRKYNMNYGIANKRRGETHKKGIYCLETDKIYKSLTECAIELNLSISSIEHTLKGRQKQAKGLTFFYADQIL